MYRVAKADSFLQRFDGALASLKEHRDMLRDFPVTDADEREQNRQLVEMVDSFDDMITHVLNAYRNKEYLSGDVAVGKLRSYLARLKMAGGNLIARDEAKRKVVRERRKAELKEVSMQIEILAGATVGFAMFAGLLLAVFFNRRMNNLLLNTRLIAINKPLGRPLGGTDELAQLDRGIHELSRELAVMRKQERELIENTADLICSLDQQLRVTQTNPAVTKILDLDEDDFLGISIQSIVHDLDKERTFNTLDGCKSGDANASVESRLRRRSGRYIDTVWNVHWSDEKKTFFCVIHDVTERKEAERLKQEVIAMVSHDLRTPLSSLGVALALLPTGALGELNEKGHSVVEKTERTVQRLIGMINDLLEVEKLEFGGFPLDKAEATVQVLAGEALEMVANEAESKHIQLKCNCGDLAVSVDRDRMRRVLVNLLGNAIKFSPRQSTIEITARTLTTEESLMPAVELRVTDHGPGIPEDKLSIVFDKFRQTGRGDEGEKAGSGLGLAICKAIVEAHGGKIGVESKVGEGSSFWFRLPSARQLK
jgi:PAS domain S-box-containing protein